MEANHGRGSKMNPSVILEDIKGKIGSSLDSIPGMLTPRATPSPISMAEPAQKKKKSSQSWDPDSEYEVETIIGYHIDKSAHITYFVKWKGWPEKYNTYEPIENLTHCNHLLMTYFEMETPQLEEIHKIQNEIEASLQGSDIYIQLKSGNFRYEDIQSFSQKHLDVNPIFSKDFKMFEDHLEREYGYIVRCIIGMYKHRDPGMFTRGQMYNIALKLCEKRKAQLKALKEMENHINTMEKCLVELENNTDFDVLPKDLTYVTDLKLGNDVIMPTDPLIGCDCQEGCNPRSRCCGVMSNSKFAYNTHHKLRLPEHTAIYECNSRCRCLQDCLNRVVQHGRKVKLGIFKTKACGWGVKALEKISKGTFVCEYVGEVIQDREAVVRDVDYCQRNISYLFDLDFNEEEDDQNMHCIDATNYGNLARYINHSCDPNLVVYPVWIDCLDPNLPRLAFFAKKNIQKNDEIHFDYENISETEEIKVKEIEDDAKKNQRLRMISRVRCQCQATSCREWVFGNK